MGFIVRYMIALMFSPQMKPCRGIEGMGCLAHLSGEAMILKPDGKAGAISDSCSQLSVF
jgi:hypothetical protein